MSLRGLHRSQIWIVSTLLMSCVACSTLETATAPGVSPWSVMTATGAPTPRIHSLAVWTGSELFVWGGRGGDDQLLNDGARYDPTTDRWLPVSHEGAPLDQTDASVIVWTGLEVLVWGGAG